MKQTLKKLFLCMLTLVMSIGSAWAETKTIELTWSDITEKAYSTSETSFTKNDVTFGYINTMFNNANGTPNGWAKEQVIQMKASAGSFYNNTAMNLKSLRVYTVVNTNTFSVVSGTSSKPSGDGVSRPTTPTGTLDVEYTTYAKDVPSETATITASYYDFDLSGANYFLLKPGSKVVYIYKLVVTYEEGGGQVTPPAPKAYALTFANNAKGTYSATVDGSAVASGKTVVAGKTVTLSCTPNNGYKFNGWNVYTTDNKANVAVSENNTFKMPEAAVTVDASYTEVVPEGNENNVTFGNLGFKSWGKDAAFSGTAADEVTQTIGGVTFTYTRNTGSIYANTGAIRFYKDNNLTFAAPQGKVITSIVFSGSGFKADATSNVATCTSSTTELSWAGKAGKVVFTRPKDASGYMTLSSVVVTLEDGVDEGGGTDTPSGSVIPNFIKTASLTLEANAKPYDVRECLNIPSDYDTSAYAITTTINGVTEKDGEFACVYPWLLFKKAGSYKVHVTAAATSKYAKTEGDITVTVTGGVAPEPEVKEYKSLTELLAAGEPAETATKVTVTLTNEAITDIYLSGSYRNGVYLMVGEKEIEIYCRNVPNEWVVGGTISGTLKNCDWKSFKGTWELCPADWSELTYKAPAVVPQYAVNYEAPENGTLVVMNGETVVESGSKLEAGTKLTLVITPAAGYEFAKWEALEGDKVIFTCTDDRRDWTVGTKDVTFKAYFTKIVPNSIWDLSEDETASATDTEMKWVSDVAMMVAAKADATIKTNNYYPGAKDSNDKYYTSTRFYKGSTLTITPAVGVKITSVVCEATSAAYTTALVESAWTNATATNDGQRVSIIPTDGTKAFSAVLSGTVGATSVKVYYEGKGTGQFPEAVTYTVSVAANIAGGSVTATPAKAEEGATVTLTATPADGYEFTAWNVTDAKGAKIDVKDNKFTMPASNVNVGASFTKKTVDPEPPVVEDHTIVCESAKWISSDVAPQLSASANGYTLVCVTNGGATKPAYNSNGKDVRLYAKNSITISSEVPFTSVVFNISAAGLKRLAPVTADCGTIAEQKAGDKTVTWTTGVAVKEVTFTVGDKAEFGTESSGAGQLDFTSIDIVSGEATNSTVSDLIHYIDALRKGEAGHSLNGLNAIIKSILMKK